MQIIVIAAGYSQQEFNDKGMAEGVQLKFVSTIEEANGNADAFFYLLDENNLDTDKDAISHLPNLVFVNAVTTSLDQLPANAVRINAWPGFLLTKSLEISATENNKKPAAHILETMGWQYNFVPDVVGMVSPRTIAMIVNEAYFALGEKVSTKPEIDTAMKLGTSYPYGPFEWSKKIGVDKIILLLQKLEETDKRYKAAPLLLQETGD